MEKILAKLKAANISESDLEMVKTAFVEAVETRVNEEKQVISEKADEYVNKKVNSIVAEKTAKLEELANQFCEKKSLALAKKADAKIKEQMQKVEKAAEQYICDYFDEKFAEKYQEELTMIEESVLTKLDQYLEFAITEKISPRLIEKTAVTETFAPIIEGIQHLFQEQYVPLNTSGAKKLKEMKSEKAALEGDLRKQINENMKLCEQNEQLAKKALIAEKTAGMTSEQRAKVEKMFEATTFKKTQSQINDYCEMIMEKAEQMRKATPMLSERHSRPARRNSFDAVEDTTDNIVTEKFKKPVEEADEFLAKAARFMV